MGTRPTANRQRSEKNSIKNRAKIYRKSMKNRADTVPGDPRSSSEVTGAQKSRKKTWKSRFGDPPGTPRRPKIHRKMHEKNGQKTEPSKNDIFRNLGASWAFRHRFSSILGPKMDAPDHRFSIICGDRVFASIFDDCCRKNEKTRKMKK